MRSLHCFVVLAICGSTLALSGEFVPKSFYTIDEHGHKSDVIYLRKSIVPRYRRSAYPSDAAYGGAISFDGPSASDIVGAVESGLSGTLQQIKSLASRSGVGEGGGGGTAYSGSFSTSGAGGPGGGAVLHSRFAGDASGVEREYVTGGGGGINAAANARGPHGAFSSSSSSIDSNGQAQYSVNARKF